MSERVSIQGTIAAALIAVSFVSNTHAASSLAFEQPAEGRPSADGIPASNGTDNSDPVPSASKAQLTYPEGGHSAPVAFEKSRCETLEGAAASQGLSIDFFTRLIRQQLCSKLKSAGGRLPRVRNQPTRYVRSLSL
jgi:hypothetical protein